MSREFNKEIAQETVDICNKGYYINLNRKRVEIEDDVKRAIESTVLLDNIEVKDEEIKGRYFKLRDNIVSCGTVNTIIDLRNKGVKGEIIALNFASAKNPGGGFLKGSMAQEESIAIASALYPCLITKNEFYDFHIKSRTPIYSDKMIYSKDVPIFRNDNSRLLDDIALCSFLTSPAVNCNAAIERGIKQSVINEAMKLRINKIISFIADKKPEVAVLGAYGCGVFGNNRELVFTYFEEAINKFIPKGEIKIIFAIK